MCFNFAFIPVVYMAFVETNGYSLEKLDAILPRRTRRKRIRSLLRDGSEAESLLILRSVMKRAWGGAEHKERRSGSGSGTTLSGGENVHTEKFDPLETQMTGATGEGQKPET